MSDDKLRAFVEQNREAFDVFEPADLWSGIEAGLASATFIKLKFPKSMIKFGFGASAIVIATVATIVVQTEKAPHKNLQSITIAAPERSLLDSNPSLISHFIKTSPIPKKVEEKGPQFTAQFGSCEDMVSPPAEVFAEIPFITDQKSDTVKTYAAKNTVDTVFGNIKKLEVKGKFCNVRVKGTTSKQLHLRGEMQECDGAVVICGVKTTKKIEYTIRYKEEGGTLKVWIDEEELKNHKQISISKNDSYKESFLEFEVPESTELIIGNSSGNVSASGIKATQVKLQTSFGNVTANDITGELSLNSSSGNIKITKVVGNINSESNFGNQHFTDVQGNIVLQSSSGDVTINNLKGNAKLQSSFGKQQLENVEGNYEGVASSGNIIVKHLKGNINLKTSFGDQSFEDVTGDITSTSGSGDIKLTGSSGVLSLVTTFGDIRGKEIRLNNNSEFRASSGNISLSFLNQLKELSFDLHSSSGSIAIDKEGNKSRSDNKLLVGEGAILVRGVTNFGDQAYR